jgi:FkbM family methyltransferase
LIYEFLLRMKHSPKPLGLQGLINTMFYAPDRVQLDTNRFDYVEVDGFKFHVTDQIDSVQRVEGNSWFDGIQKGDVVLDIGANIGAITIPLAKTAAKVIALEPLFYDLLIDNVKLNGYKNVFVYPAGLSDESTLDVAFSSRRQVVNCMTFPEILECIGEQIDFLKVDCEGGEWSINPAQLKGIRELRLEFHIRRGKIERDTCTLFGDWFDWLTENKYEFEITEGDTPPPFHQIKECYLLKASKCG